MRLSWSASEMKGSAPEMGSEKGGRGRREDGESSEGRGKSGKILDRR